MAPEKCAHKCVRVALEIILLERAVHSLGDRSARARGTIAKEGAWFLHPRCHKHWHTLLLYNVVNNMCLLTWILIYALTCLWVRARSYAAYLACTGKAICLRAGEWLFIYYYFIDLGLIECVICICVGPVRMSWAARV